MKRWLLWNVRCWRGRRCADVIAIPDDTLPKGIVPVINYTCGGCGTHYEWRADTFRRQRVEASQRYGDTHTGRARSLAPNQRKEVP